MYEDDPYRGMPSGWKVVHVRDGEDMSGIDIDKICTMTPRTLRSFTTGVYHTVPIYVSQGQNKLPINVGDVPIRAARTMLPAIGRALERRGISDSAARAIILPEMEPAAAKYIVSHIKISVQMVWRQELDIVFDTPITSYHAIGKAAAILGRSDIAEVMERRVSNMLFPSLYKKTLQINKKDLEAAGNATYDGATEVRAVMADAIGRAVVAGKLDNGEELLKVEFKYRAIYNARMTAMLEWTERKENGEDIRAKPQ